MLLACAPQGSFGPCSTQGDELVCPYASTTIDSPDGGRQLLWSAPDGEGPFGVALLFQGSSTPPVTYFEGTEGEPFGGIEQVRLTAELLDAGWIVVAPATWAGGLTWWNTNVAPWVDDWGSSPDAAMISTLFDELDGGTFGDVDPTRIVAAGVSSGGYMTSRMAIEHPDRLARVVIAAGSYATCLGAACTVPATLPEEHPPTLFLHGGADDVVPLSTMEPYADGLAAAGVDVDVEVEEDFGHGWIDGAAELAVAWFEGG